MREQWARRIVLITGMLILLLTTLFAFFQNSEKLPDTRQGGVEKDIVSGRSEIIVPDPKIIQSGILVYKQQSCARCHAIGGKGNPRNPLDDVGTKSAEELRAWITGSENLQGKLSIRVIKKKQLYSELSSDDLEALIIYMQSL